MKSYNRIEFKGGLGRDAQVRNLNDNSVANLSVATEYETRRRDGSGYDKETTWIDVVAWKGYGIADFSQLKKGVRVSGVGRLRKRKYTDSQGIEKEIYEVVASELDIIVNETPPQTQQPQQQSYQPRQTI